MDIESVSAYLGISTDSVRYMVRTRRIPTTKVGKRLKFRKADVDKYLQDIFGAA